jgi:aspartyl-tRNA(Asn)/glutamyl-tRNA(Gln) amidotransferase subunit C
MKIDINHLAQLANLPLTDEEIEKLSPQLGTTLEYIEQLNEINTDGVEPTAHVTGLKNVTREDTPIESFIQEDALLNAKEKHNGLFKVNAILEND